MINLIPKDKEKEMNVDFYLRLFVLILLMLSFTVFVACASILPAYFLAAVKHSVIDKKITAQNSQPIATPGVQTLSAIKDINTKLDLVENSENKKFLISEKIISEIVSRKIAGIKITQISYSYDQTGRKVVIQGVASSRETLLLFRQALSDDPLFKNVNLPISNFVKSTNIQYNLTLISA